VITYTVVDLSRDGSRFLLQDPGGMLHVARADGLALLRDDVLLGREAKLGTHLLVTADTHKPLPVSFEAVACTQAQALALLHPGAALAGDS
jgi:hypothetical protein